MKKTSTRSIYPLLALPLLGGMAATVQAQPDYGPALWHACCNANWYTSGYGHKFCVVHDMEGYYASTVSYFTSCGHTSSSVYYACNGLQDTSTDAPAGQLTQMVREAYYAWHACCWNQYSFGCEHEGFASNPAWYTEAMYQASGGLYKHWCEGYGIAKDRNHVVAHGEKSNANWVAYCNANFGCSATCNSHTDPGQYWNWNHYMDIINGVTYINPPYYFDSDAQGFTAGNSLSAVSWSGTGWPGIIYADQTGNDAFYYSPNTSYTGGAECSVNVSVYPQSGTTANHDMQMFYRTAADNTFSAGKSSPIVSYTLQNNWGRINLDINASWPTYYNQTILGLRLDVDNNNSSTRWIVNHIIPQGSLRWRFDSDPQGWTSANSLSAISWSGSGWPGIIYADQTGNDPQFLSTGGWQMYGGINDTVHVHVYPQNGSTANHDMQVFFASGNENFFSEDKSITVYYTAQNGWADVWFDLGVNGKWNGDYIRQIRLDVDQINQGNRWIIDSVTVEHNTYASYIHAPAIGQQPAAQTVNQGGAATFTVFPNGPSPFTFQWQKNGVNIPGASGTTSQYAQLISYTVSNAQSSDAANYDCVVSNSGGSTTSSSVGLTVNVPPTITTQPQSQTANAGDNATFTVTASGTAPLSYQWTLNTVSISGATASSYTRSNVQLTDAGSYAVVVSNVAGNATSANAVLTVNSSQPPSITTQPVSQTVNQGASPTFTVVAGGAAPLSYQWTFNGGNISGATASAYTVSNAQPGNAGSYAVVVTNAYGTATSSTATLTVNVPPSITTQPASQTITQGGNATFTVTAAGTAPLTYQWTFNGGNISGATTSSFTKSNAQGTDAGSYAVIVTNVAGTVTSANAVLTVNVPPSITTQPASQTVIQGANATFTVTAAGTSPLSYQWTFNGGNISGATASSYTKSNAQSTDAGSYAVVVTNIVGAVTSANATLTVNIPPSITTQPASQTVAGGANATFTVTAAGTAPLSYQWTFNGGNISGATASSYTKTNVGLGDQGSYAVVVTNVAGTVTSANAVLTVNVPPSITTQPASQTANLGANVTFTVTAGGSPTLAYQWQLNGASISGATASSYTKNNVQAGDVGYYSVLVTNAFGSVTSTAAVLTMSSALPFNEDFESGNLNNWGTCVSPATALSISTSPVHGGTYSATMGVTTAKMYHNLPAPVSGHAKFTFWGYDDTGSASNGGQTRWFGEARSYAGGSYNSGGVQQLFASGRYGVGFGTGTGIFASETVDTTKYQGRVLSGANTGYFNLSGAASRSVGWHKFEVEVLASGTVNFSVDGTQGRSVPSVTLYAMDDLTMGSIGSGSSSGNAWFDDIKAEYYDAPSISTQPASQTVNAGSTVTFTVGTSGTVTSYQWIKNGAAISGATTSSLALSNVQQTDAASYSVVIANGIAPVTSSTALLAVTDIAPVITTQPVSQTATQGANVTFTVAASGTTPMTYQWTFNTVNIPGATQSSLTKNNVQGTDSGSYAAVVSNSVGNTTSATATLSVGVPPSITTQPASQTANIGANVTFSVVAAGTAPLSYQWTFNGANISGATTTSYTKSNVQTTDAGSYAVVVTNSVGSATSANAVLSVNTPPSITTQPASQTVNQGANATFSVVAAGTAPLSYQWTFNGGNISGATATSYTKSNVQPTDAGSYAVVVTNVAGTVTSANAVLSVNIPPSITTQPASQTVNQGASATFTVTAAGTAPLTYQWTFNGGNISGATASSYTKSNAQSTDAGSYAVAVTNMAGTVTSANAVLSVNLPPSITTQPSSQSVAKGTNVTFTVTATGTAPLTYQWKFNGANVSGATASSYTKSNVQSTDAGSYSVGVTNMAGGVLSASAVLTVNSPPTLSLGSSRDVEQVVTFETITDYNNDHVMFRKPANSSTTSAFLDTTQSNSTAVVTSGWPSGNPNGDGAKVLKVTANFKTGQTNPWLRLTTASSSLIPNPAFDFSGRIRFDIYADKSVMIALGLRETGTSVAVGASGGTTGAIEWVGATGKTGTAPNCTRTITAATWTTVEVNLRAESCYSFNAGNGVLDGNQGVLEHLAVVPNGGTGAYNIWLDNFQMVYTNNLPTDTVTMNSNSTLTFTAAGSDPDAGQTLTYSLLSPPSGASINSSTGAFTWTPTSGATTNTITVQVADNGTPSQNTQSSFTAIVNNDPLGVMSIGDSALAAGEPLKLTWAAAPGASYQVQFKQGDGEWTNLGDPITTDSAEGAVEISGPATDVSYRVIELGGAVSDQ